MSLTVNTFPDLVRIVETHPEWRRKLIRVLFPEIDLPKAFQELAESQRRLESLMERVAATNEQLARLQAQSEARIARLEIDMAGLKGTSHELNYRDKAVSIFGRYLRCGHDVTNEVADQLHAATEAGRISEQEFEQVLAADLLWGGQLRKAAGELILVVEASWQAALVDVERAVARANILRQIGLRALPVVASREWTLEAEQAAQRLGVVMTTDGGVDPESWPDAW